MATQGLSGSSKGLALVTGASNGIGYHLALQLAQEGYDLVIAGKEQDLTAQAAAAFQAEGVQVSSHVADLSKTLDIACINAGLGVGGDFIKTPLEQEIEVGSQLRLHRSPRKVRHAAHGRAPVRSHPLHRFHRERDARTG